MVLLRPGSKFVKPRFSMLTITPSHHIVCEGGIRTHSAFVQKKDNDFSSAGSKCEKPLGFVLPLQHITNKAPTTGFEPILPLGLITVFVG